MSPLVIILLLVGVLVIWLIAVYNRLVSLKLHSEEALSDIDVQSKRRFDLIPNLVETVKGYMNHEADVLENVAKARSGLMSASGNVVDRAGAENQLTNTLKTLFAVSENYPDLKANANFLDLQRELADTENKMLASRRFYNANVRDFSIMIDRFPSNIIAKMFGFAKLAFFEVSNAEERNAPQVKF